MFHDPSIWDMFPLSFFYELKRRLGGKGLKHLHSLITKYNLQTLPDFKDFTSFSIDNDVKLERFAFLLYGLGRELVKRGKTKDAERAYLISLRLKPKGNFSHVDLVVLYAMRCRTEEALFEAQKVLNNLDYYGQYKDAVYNVIMDVLKDLNARCADSSLSRKKKSYSSLILLFGVITLIVAILFFLSSQKTSDQYLTYPKKSPQIKSKTTTPYSSFSAGKRKPLVSKSKYEGNHLNNGDSPYDYYFGKGIYNPNSLNSIIFKNHREYDAIVLLVDVQSKKVVRNEYIRARSTFEMTKIPNGTYYIKVFMGKNWNPEKELLNGRIKGAFEKDLQFYKCDKWDDWLSMRQYYTEDKIYYSRYEITLYPVPSGNMERVNINAEEFFGK